VDRASEELIPRRGHWPAGFYFDIPHSSKSEADPIPEPQKSILRNQMSSGADFLRWLANCHTRPGSGICAGDTTHHGLGEYVEMFPCPNGLPIDYGLPRDSPVWRAKVEKAKRDSERISGYFRTCGLADQLTEQEVRTALERVIKWEQEQSQQQSPLTSLKGF